MIWRLPELATVLVLAALAVRYDPRLAVLAVLLGLWWGRQELRFRPMTPKPAMLPAGTDRTSRREERA